MGSSIRDNLFAIVTLTAALLARAHSSGVLQGSPRLDAAVFAHAIQPGEVVRLDVTCACVSTPPTATVFASHVALAPIPGGVLWRGWIGIDLETKPGMYPVNVRVGQPPITTTVALDVHAKRFLTRRLRVADGLVNPPVSALTRIAREAAQLEALFKVVTPAVWDAPFLPPVMDSVIRNFGVRSIFNGQLRNPHAGIDFRSPADAPVAAPGPGRVVLADDLFFTGRTVVIDHGLGLYSVLAHLSRIAVADGDRVQRGAIVGLVGATGRVTGPHLHWAVRLNGARVDPLSLLVALHAASADPPGPSGLNGPTPSPSVHSRR